ncbi:Soluble inorganic pyrophosphatase 2 [Micractinium conductrix]|uniref:Enhancer of polycomb-like protein n=1 Tax=Micractinium conductrix TaxID=554055 RepID=A0A2P6VKM2_9CHLO|nr:Soluble inorganic pyrophosphatase 2 [Micractinium conductrix]|eukprot:PSC74628.1 Soluble inorganic pyrophosphatase 2 [Micractinium conductrix]
MPGSRVMKSQRGGGGGGRGRSGGGSAPVAPPPDEPLRLPRGSRETAALLRANGYALLNKEKLRRPQAQAQQGDGERAQQHAQPAAAGEQQQQQQQSRKVQRRQQEQQAEEEEEQQDQQLQRELRPRMVRIVEPPRSQHKRKHGSSSDDEEYRPSRSARGAPAAPQPPPPQPQVQQPGMKRVRSSWKMRPLLIDEKVTVFWEGRDHALLHYDGGEFHQWLLDCEAGLADPSEGLPYPLVVQDKELRTLLEIKPAAEAGPGQPGGELRAAAAQAAAAAAAAVAGDEGPAIIVPTVRTLPAGEQPDLLVREQEPPVVQRMQDAEGPDVAGTSAAARAASDAWRSAKRAVALDPPYIRYVQPTPDDLDLAVEYDLDDEDEEWLEAFNTEAKRAKSRKARRTCGEEWMEHLIDRMEKEYTAELQRHPGKWVVQAAEPGSSDQLPAVVLPSIEEVFPLDKCLQVPGINHYESVIEAVYEYWKGKHQRAGRPLIQRLWYEPPWDRRKAARVASTAEDEGGDEEGPFAGQDSPVALAGIRKRRLDPEEASARFQEMRRDLESARTLADQVRKREKLKRRELQLYKEEWAARMQAIHDGAQRVVARQGQLQNPPAQLSAVARLPLGATWLLPTSSGDTSEDALHVGAPQDAAAQAEHRAARLAQRRFARDVGSAVAQAPQRQQQQEARRLLGRPRGSPAAGGSQRRAELEREHPAVQAAQHGGGAGTVLKQSGNVRGPPAPPGVRRQPVCVWCHSGEFLMLGCASCPRCFCFKCFQRRPGLGINNWSRAVKDSTYRCVICRGVEADDAPSANTASEARPADAADATSPQRGRRPAPQPEEPTAARIESERRAQELGVEVPRGLGGAALRSFLIRLQKQRVEEADEEEEGSEQQQALASPASPRPRATAGGHGRRQQPRGSSDEEGDGEEDGRRLRQRRLGGAALASHVKRLEVQRAGRGQGGCASDDEQPSSDGEEAWPHPHIPPPPRKLGGAALRSYIKRQEALLEAGDEEDASDSSEGWPYSHIPPPPRKLGGAALRSYIKRQEALLEDEDEDGGEQQQQLSGSSSGTAEEFGASSGEAGGGSSDGEVSQRKENRAPPAKRPRKAGLGGAALASHKRRMAAEAAAAEAARERRRRARH